MYRIFRTANEKVLSAYREGRERHAEWQRSFAVAAAASGFAPGEVQPVTGNRLERRVLLGFRSTFTKLDQHGFRYDAKYDVFVPADRNMPLSQLGDPGSSLDCLEGSGMPSFVQVSDGRAAAPAVVCDEGVVRVIWDVPQETVIEFDEKVWSEE